LGGRVDESLDFSRIRPEPMGSVVIGPLNAGE
jgi:hypothetical protein